MLVNIPPYSDLLAAREKMGAFLSEKQREAVTACIKKIVASEMTGISNSEWISDAAIADLVVQDLCDAGWKAERYSKSRTMSGRHGPWEEEGFVVVIK